MSHHYGEESSSLTVGPKNYILQFHNKVTDKTIRMVIPREGSGPTRRSEVKEEKDLWRFVSNSAFTKNNIGIAIVYLQFWSIPDNC